MFRIISTLIILFCAQNCFSQFYIKFQSQNPIFTKYSFSVYMSDFSDKNVRQSSVQISPTVVTFPCDSTKTINLLVEGDPGFVTGSIINCGDSIIADMDKNTFQIFKRKP